MSTARSRISTNTSSSGPRSRFTGRIREVRTWALAHGHVAAPEALALICEVKAARPGEFDTWRLGDVDELLWVELVSWCRTLEMPVPEQVPESLWTYLGYLHATSSFTGDSHPLDALRVPLSTISGLDRSGRPPQARAAATPTPARSRRLRAPRRRDIAPVVPLRPRMPTGTAVGE